MASVINRYIIKIPIAIVMNIHHFCNIDDIGINLFNRPFRKTSVILDSVPKSVSV